MYGLHWSRPLVLSGPSGSGKSTLLKRLFGEFPGQFAFSVSHTTRAPRPGEVNGVQYHFVSREDFISLLNQGGFVEHAEFSGNLYGTSKHAIASIIKSGKRCILDIEVQGVRQIKETDLNPVYCFISPPTLSILRDRLVSRGTESEAAVQKRLKTALFEIDYAKLLGTHDYIIVNDDLDRAYTLFKSVAFGELVSGDPLPPLDH
ncbi:guanylate kinase [Multifurca ochricompacta]|uniref:Guanylate kinase n=1 Tax=Multifurca ochricompacta TaxID=376703 RepID=A0AAD4MBD8_9AGAM|nr:guanylate kinase [Multifurca ochricompacta]